MSKDKLTWQRAIIVLRDNGVTEIVITYSGSGDSGAIDCISYMNKEDQKIPHKDIDINHDEVNNLCYPLLENIEDWYNNDGGDGTVIINLLTLKYDIDNNINIVGQKTFKHKGSINKIMKDNS